MLVGVGVEVQKSTCKTAGCYLMLLRLLVRAPSLKGALPRGSQLLLDSISFGESDEEQIHLKSTNLIPGVWVYFSDYEM